MSSAENKAVFLSYASQDAEAAQRICAALRAAGVEVWFDQSELVGGDAWDQKIRGQISSCALFIPVISAATQARLEGYFRLEWKLAAQRTHTMADEKAFLLPVTIDATKDAEAKVPAEFKAVQWTRLPGGEASAKFCERVKRLLGGEMAEPGGRIASPADEAAGHRASDGPQTVAVGRQRRGSRLGLAGATAVVALLVAGGMFLARRWQRAQEENPRPPAKADAAASTTAPATGARELVAKARALFESTVPSRDDFALAENYCRQALKLDENDAEVWAAYAELSSFYFRGGYDTSPERMELARVQAERAVKLAPRSFEARFAKASYLRGFDGPALAEAEKILRELAAENPGDGRVLIALGKVIWGALGPGRNLARGDEALAVFARAEKIPSTHAESAGQRGWLLFNLERYPEAEAAIDDSLRLEPSPILMGLKVEMAIWRGDLATAEASLARLPAEVLQIDNAVGAVAELWLLAREPDKCLATLSPITRDYLSSNTYIGAVDGLRADAYQLAGKTEAARNARQTALRVVERRLGEQPRDGALLAERARLLALLDEREAAVRALRLYGEIFPNPNWSATDGKYFAGLAHVLLDPPDAAIELLARQGVPLGYLRLDFRFDSLRGHPRFEALLAAAPAPQAKTSGTGGAAAADTKSVAVLAFTNLSDDKGNEYFSDGISEELLNVLAKVPGLKVAARTSAFYFKDKNVPIPEIAQKLGVAYVVEGSVRKAGTQVRITAQLINAADGFHVWSDTFTRELKDIFAVQDEIAGLIAKNLQLKMGAAARVARTVDPEAHRLVLEGRYFWNLRTDEGFARAETAFVRAIEIDPEYAEAHSGLAGVCVIRDQYRVLDGYDANPADAGRARTEAQRAIELEPTLAEPHAVLGYGLMFENRLAESEQEFQRALALNPNDPVVRCWHANNLAALGRIDQSLPEYEKAAELDPLWFINYQVYLRGLVSAQRYGDALKTASRAAALRAETDIFIPSLGYVAEASLALGRKDEAVETARRVRRYGELRPRWDADAQAIYVLREAGFGREAEDYAKEVFARLPSGSYMRGWILVALGRLDEALPFLEQRQSGLLLGIYWGTMWDPWREDPRFGQILAKNGRTEEYKVARTTLTRMLQERATTK